MKNLEQSISLTRYLAYMDRVEKGEMNITQAQYAKELGISEASLSQCFKTARKQLSNITAEERDALVFTINRNLTQTAFLGTKLGKRVVEEALNGNEDMVDQALKVSRDALDRIPQTSRESVKLQVTNINQNVSMPILIQGADVRDGLEEIIDGEQEVDKDL